MTAHRKRVALAPWQALLLLIVAFIGVYAALLKLRAAIMPHLGLSGAHALAAFRGSFDVEVDWLLHYL